MKKVVVTGGSGFVGRGLVDELLARGDEVTVLTRDPSRSRDKVARKAKVAAYTPDRVGPWTKELEGASAVVHLAGESVVQRWTDAAKDRILRSRVDSTRVVVEAIGALANKPEVFVCASAIGFYGARPADEVLDEESASGEGFLADVVRRWEAEAREAAKHGVRDVELRIGLSLGEGGGAMEKMVLPFKLFAGGHVGDGRHVMSWIHNDDVIGLALLAIDDPRAKGPINAVAPRAVTSAEMSRALGAVMKRPSWLPAPRFALELAMGEMAMVLTTGQRVTPRRAMELGYAFRRPELEAALRSILQKA